MTTLVNFLAATLTGLLLVGGLTVLLVVVLGWSRERGAGGSDPHRQAGRGR